MMAAMLVISEEELVVRLSNQAAAPPVVNTVEKPTDAQTQEYLQRAEDVTKAVE